MSKGKAPNPAAALDRALASADVKKSLQGSFPKLGAGDYTLKFDSIGFKDAPKGVTAFIKWVVESKKGPDGKDDPKASGRQWTETYNLWVVKDDGKGGKYFPFLGRLVDDLVRIQTYLPQKLFETREHFAEQTGARLQEVFDALNDTEPFSVAMSVNSSKDGKEYRNIRAVKKDQDEPEATGVSEASAPEEVAEEVAEEAISEIPDVGTAVTFTYGGKPQKGIVVKVNDGSVNVTAKIDGKYKNLKFANPASDLTWTV